jgi:hypothetical protein
VIWSRSAAKRAGQGSCGRLTDLRFSVVR